MNLSFLFARSRQYIWLLPWVGIVAAGAIGVEIGKHLAIVDAPDRLLSASNPDTGVTYRIVSRQIPGDAKVFWLQAVTPIGHILWETKTSGAAELSLKKSIQLSYPEEDDCTGYPAGPAYELYDATTGKLTGQGGGGCN